ncbi:AMP-binding protein [Archangium violaceum]|uniref:AMP-binding protein n=1 Tax=Archangium violaceum TaxID=83451 RepID=UPI00193B0CEE|nr:AMP-binding protein [Archangium violaceum]QRK07274.1 AMP-binding protein [Archangium violaceum]
MADAAVEVTYAQLRERTRRLAGMLRARGIGRGDVVAIVMDRGPAFVETAIAVWRSGAAYLPLAPAHPAAWREDVIRRVGRPWFRRRISIPIRCPRTGGARWTLRLSTSASGKRLRSLAFGCGTAARHG